MAEVLRFFKDYESTIYFILGIGIAYYGWHFGRAWQDGKQAIFGLEQVSSRKRINQAAISIFIMLVMGFVIFVLVTFIAPTIKPQLVLPINTETVEESLMTAQPTELGGATPNPLAPATPLPTVSVDTDGCLPGELEILSPESGAAISGEIPVEGTVNITNLGFYKFEIAEISQELWLTIQAGRGIVNEGVLVESWDTSLMPPGEYVLQLVATTSDGTVLPACRIPVRIGAAP